jgi:hypothetical protein
VVVPKDQINVDALIEAVTLNDGPVPHAHEKWDCPYFTDNPEHFGYYKVAYKRSHGGYDWSAFGVWQAEDDSLWWWGGGGCSCNSPDDALPGELTLLNDTSVTSAFGRAIQGTDATDSAGRVEILRAIKEVLS